MTEACALAVPLWGQDLALDREALAGLRARHPALRLYAVCLEGVVPDAAAGFDRVIALPLERQHLGHADAIGLQLCLNERNQMAGILRRLDAAELADAARHFAQLAQGQADAIIVSGAEARLGRLFLAERAAFLASPWAALGGELLEDRGRITAGLLGLAGRKGVAFAESAHGYSDLPRCDLASLAPRAPLLREKLGLLIGRLPTPRARPVKRVAVVTPYYREPDHELRRVIDSVRKQSRAATHILVSDGFPKDLARDAGGIHIALGQAHGDNGNTPRYVGAMVALALGFDGVAFLDADNWFEAKHIERLVDLQHESGATAVFALRNIFLPDGHKLPHMDGEDHSRSHADTSAMLLTRACEYALHLWGQMPQEWGPVCDRVVFAELGGQRLAWSRNRTVNFQSNYAGHYRAAGRAVPERVNEIPLTLWHAFHDMQPDFRARSISRTGRVIRVIGA